LQFGFGAHVGAEKRELPGEEKAEVDLGVVARGGPAGDQAASSGKAGEAIIPGGGANVLENNVDAALVGLGGGLRRGFFAFCD